MEVTLDNYSTVELDTLPINDSWDGRDVHENLMHRIHAYPAKFPAFITTKAIQYAESKDVKVDTVADIFCGCGTVALEAKIEGVDLFKSCNSFFKSQPEMS